MTATAAESVPHGKNGRQSQSPFAARLEAAAYVGTPVQDEALARLQFLCDSRKRLGLLIGPAGAGKSLVLEVFAHQQRREMTYARRISLLGLEPPEFLEQVAEAWNVSVQSRQSSAIFRAAIAAKLAEFRICGVSACLLLDDLDDSLPETLTQVLRLLVHDESARSPLTVVLAGRPGIAHSLPLRLLELVDLRIDVDAWNLAETEALLNQAVQSVGRAESIFTADAIKQIHALSGGIARHVLHLAELALIAAAGTGLECVDGHTVDTVHAELASV